MKVTPEFEQQERLTELMPVDWFWRLLPHGMHPHYTGRGSIITRMTAKPEPLRGTGWVVMELQQNMFAMRSRHHVVMCSAHAIPDRADEQPGIDQVYDRVRRWIHLSMSHRDRCPTWEELVALRDLLFTDQLQMLQVLPPKSNHVSIHPNCLHLWHSPDGDGLPDFTLGTGTI